MSMINTTSDLKAQILFIFQHFSFGEQLKFHAQLSKAYSSFITAGPGPYNNNVFQMVSGRIVQGSVRDLKQFIRFSTVVRRVEYNKVTDEFTVTANHLKTDREVTDTFSHVVVATGMFSTPKMPDVPGIDGFKGRVLHSKNVKHLHEFKGQRVLLIGSFLSAEDLASMLWKFGAARVIIAYKYRPLGRNWPNGIEERHLAVKFEGNVVYFQDGTDAIVDAVVFCTGYILEFPFMSEELRLKTDLLSYPENLYKGILWINGGNNKLMYIGMQYIILTFATFDCQAIWAVRNITGKISLPSTEEMLADSVEWVELAKDATKNHCFLETFEFLKKYFRYVVESVDYSKDTLKLMPQFHKKLDEQCRDICTWRDQQFDCIYTGNTCPALKTPWVDNLEDCVESFVKNY